MGTYAGKKRGYGGKGKGRKKARTSSSFGRGGKGKAMTYGGGKRTGGWMGLENKFVDFEITGNGLPVNTTPSGSEMDPAETLSLSAIAQGDGESQRDGRKVVLNHINFNGMLKLNPQQNLAVGLDAVAIRCAIVWDTQTNQAQFNGEDVFETQNVPTGFRNLQFTKRFRVLYDETFSFAYPSAVGTSASNDLNGQMILFSVFKKLNIPVLFNGTTANVSTITDNSLHVMCWASESGVCSFNYSSRVRFMG